MTKRYITKSDSLIDFSILPNSVS